MSNEALIAALSALCPSVVVEEGGEWLNMQIAPGDWLPFATQLRNREDLHFDYLFCLTCVDWKTHLGMVYHLRSTRHGHHIVVKSKLDRDHPEIETVSRIWRTAEFNEREAAEMFGVQFLHHPDPRKLILPDDWTGFPMRKDYDDPVNMIKL